MASMNEPSDRQSGLIPVRLTPVEVFGTDSCCEHGEHTDCPSTGYGVCDAVSTWSDCNRAVGHIFRFEDLPNMDARQNGTYREPGETLIVWVDPDEFQAFYERKFGSD